MELTKEQLEVKIAVLLQENINLREQLLDARILNGDIALEPKEEKAGK